MATIGEVKEKLEFLKSKAQGEKFREATEEFDRNVQYDFTDLNYRGYFSIRNGVVEGPSDGDHPDPEITVTLTSDTFFKVLNKEMDPLTALIKGHIKIKASFWDLMKLKNLGG